MKTKRKSRMTVFNEGFYVRAYELAREGMSGTKLAKALGVGVDTLLKWKKKYPYFKEAIERARKHKEDGTHGKFMDFVYGRLTPDLQLMWDKIERWKKEESGLERIEAMLEEGGLYTRMSIFVHALVKSDFNVSEACRITNVCFETLEKWATSYPDFGKILAQVTICKKDFLESHLMKLVASGDSPATIFANKTFNRDRGYNDKVEVEMSGSIQQTHLVDITVLNLPVDVKRLILDAWRKHRDVLQGKAIEHDKTAVLEYKRQGDKAIPVEEEEAA